MCTSIALKGLFGRNMDIDYNFGECIVNTPRSFPLHFKTADAQEKHYAFIGTAAVIGNMSLYAEAMNENGLYIAALKFPENAYYNKAEVKGKINLAPYEIIPFILGKCRNLSEAKTVLRECEIAEIPFSENLPLSPLHWHIADKNGSAVLEKTAEGMKIYDNPSNVLTNNPPFPFHIENRAHFIKLSPYNPDPVAEKMLGLGTVGLPGDFTPSARFARADFLLRNTPENCKSASHFFHILDNVAIPEGAVVTPDGKYHCTTYSCCFDAEKLTYSCKTYDDMNIRTVTLNTEGDKPVITDM